MNPAHAINNRARRSGVALIWALVILAVLGVTSATAIWHGAAARRALERRENSLQALWLARSAGELAAAGLLGDLAYTGETVELIADSRVRIDVAKDEAKPDTYRIRCEVHYAEEGPAPVGLTITWIATRRLEPAGVRLELLGDGG